MPSPDAFADLPKRLRLLPKESVALIGVGKASLSMAWCVNQIASVSQGLLTVPPGYIMAPSASRYPLSGINIVEGDHPVPGKQSRQAVAEVRRIVDQLPDGKPVVILISGGGSALWGAPAPGITLEQYERIILKMATAAMPIDVLNIVRSRIGNLSGGRLQQILGQRRTATYVLSDVPGGDLGVVASGPMTKPAENQSDNFATILMELGEIGIEILRTRQTPADTGALVGIGDNQSALDGAAYKARSLGYSVTIRSGFITGEAREVGASIVRDIAETPPGSCTIYGGESTVTVTGKGRGGRNQEAALAASIDLASQKIDGHILIAGTDGIDGRTDAAGAIVNRTTVEFAQEMGRVATDFLNRNDSYSFFAGTEAHVFTGPTQTNVMDIAIALRS